MNKETKNIKYRLKKPFRYALWGLGVLCLCMVLVSAMGSSSNKTVSNVRVEIIPTEENQLLVTKKDVLSAIVNQYPHDINTVVISKIEVMEIESIIEKVPFVSDAEVYFDAQQNLHISIAQEKPLVRIMAENGDNYYLNKEAKHIPLSNHATPRVLVVTGNVPKYSRNEDGLRGEKLKELFYVVEKITNDDFYNPLIEQININQEGQYELVPKLGKHTILLGSSEDLDIKFHKIKKIYKEVFSRKGWQHYSLIDVSFKGQAVCKKD